MAVHKYRGFILVELMMALTLGLALLVPLFRLLYQTLTVLRTEQTLDRLQNKGRYITMYLQHHLAHNHCLAQGRILPQGYSPSFVQAKVANNSNSIVIPHCDRRQGGAADDLAYYVAKGQGKPSKQRTYHLYQKVKGQRAKVLVPLVSRLQANWRESSSGNSHQSATMSGRRARGIHVALILRTPGHHSTQPDATSDQSLNTIRWPMEFAIETVR